jgi:uncharacterized protein (TIGR03437 family)
VYYISPTQINVLTPPDLATGTIQVQVTTGGGTSTAFTAEAQAESPSFFILGGGPYVAATHAGGSLIGPTSLYPNQSTPAAPGETIVLYANGFGPTTTPVVKGSEVQSGSLNPLPVVTIGGAAATVQFGGLISPGDANDVEYSKISNIKGFGPTMRATLLAWRSAIEQQFQFEPNQGLDPRDLRAIEQELSH